VPSSCHHGASRLTIGLNGVVEALHGPLGLVEDAERRQAVERYVEAARVPVERAVADLMLAVTTAVGDAVAEHYRVRLVYGPDGLDVDVEPRGEQDPGSATDADWSAGTTDKITIRIPSELKEEVTRAAHAAGVSVNTWLLRAAAAGVRRPSLDERHREHLARRHERRGPGGRLTGWIGEDS
jgi:hypothetical protein